MGTELFFLWFYMATDLQFKNDPLCCSVPCTLPAATHVAGPSTHHGSARGQAAPLCSALPGFKISKADTQLYNAVLVFESLGLKGKIPCKSHAAGMLHLRSLCLVGTLCFNRSHLQ